MSAEIRLDNKYQLKISSNWSMIIVKDQAEFNVYGCPVSPSCSGKLIYRPSNRKTNNSSQFWLSESVSLSILSCPFNWKCNSLCSSSSLCRYSYQLKNSSILAKKRSKSMIYKLLRAVFPMCINELLKVLI